MSSLAQEFLWSGERLTLRDLLTSHERGLPVIIRVSGSDDVGHHQRAGHQGGGHDIAADSLYLLTEIGCEKRVAMKTETDLYLSVRLNHPTLFYPVNQQNTSVEGLTLLDIATDERLMKQTFRMSRDQSVTNQIVPDEAFDDLSDLDVYDEKYFLGYRLNGVATLDPKLFLFPTYYTLTLDLAVATSSPLSIMTSSPDMTSSTSVMSSPPMTSSPSMTSSSTMIMTSSSPVTSSSVTSLRINPSGRRQSPSGYSVGTLGSSVGTLGVGTLGSRSSRREFDKYRQFMKSLAATLDQDRRPDHSTADIVVFNDQPSGDYDSIAPSPSRTQSFDIPYRPMLPASSPPPTLPYHRELPVDVPEPMETNSSAGRSRYSVRPGRPTGRTSDAAGETPPPLPVKFNTKRHVGLATDFKSSSDSKRSEEHGLTASTVDDGKTTKKKKVPTATLR